MPEAGRKAMLVEFVRMLTHEPGTRDGGDPEDLHQMRVATRRLRSALRVFGDGYRRKAIRPYRRRLRDTARALGDVRDLDVLIADIARYRETFPALDLVIEQVDRRRQKARGSLVDWLDDKAYRRFVKDFDDFLTTPGKGLKTVDDDDIVPFQVRHVVPPMLHERLAAVRAFDTRIDGAAPDTLHRLRIAFKRLRYASAFFTGVLGTAMDDFIDELKAMQDLLGRLNDIAVAHRLLGKLKKLDATGTAAMEHYLAALAEEQAALLARFPEAWAHFNTRSVQRKFSDALLVLR